MLILDICLGAEGRLNVDKQNYVLRLELRKSLESFIARVSSIAAYST